MVISGGSDQRRFQVPEALGFLTRGEDLLRAISDAMLDPVLLDAVRDSHGRVVDFVHREVNQGRRDYLGLSLAPS